MSTTTASPISIPADYPAGGMSMTEPVTTTTMYYKLAAGNTMTFGWNMTSVLITPSALTFSAYCASNKNTYPVGTVPGTATTITWEPWAYQTGQGQQTPLAQGTYTLMVNDEQGTTAVGKAGRFNYFDGLTFAFYTPQPYTPLARESSIYFLPWLSIIISRSSIIFSCSLFNILFDYRMDLCCL